MRLHQALLAAFVAVFLLVGNLATTTPPYAQAADCNSVLKSTFDFLKADQINRVDAAVTTHSNEYVLFAEGALRYDAATQKSIGNLKAYRNTVRYSQVLPSVPTGSGINLPNSASGPFGPGAENQPVTVTANGAVTVGYQVDNRNRLGKGPTSFQASCPMPNILTQTGPFSSKDNHRNSVITLSIGKQFKEEPMPIIK